MRLVVLGLPHTLTSPTFSSCAYTMKAWNLCRMMHDRGHEVVHLGNAGSHPVCHEHVDVMSAHDWSRVYQHPDTGFFDITVDTPERKQFHHAFAESMRAEVARRAGSDHDLIVCVTWGGPQREAVLPLADRAFVVESGIGYRHSWATYRVFESYAWMHMTLGAEGRFNGSTWYWVAIPNAFDPDMFEFAERKEDYFLYLGRLTADKGVGLAVDLARRVGRRLILAGQGDPTPYLAPHVEYVGPVGVEQRKRLLAGARALICPTYYVEPFGGVNIEAQLSGTPVISTDCGIFPETVLHGITGYRCRTMEQFEYAAHRVGDLDPQACRAWALNFSLAKVSTMYEEYFQMLLDLRRSGFYEPRPARTTLDWLTREVPSGGTPRYRSRGAGRKPSRASAIR